MSRLGEQMFVIYRMLDDLIAVGEKNASLRFCFAHLFALYENVFFD